VKQDIRRTLDNIKKLLGMNSQEKKAFKLCCQGSEEQLSLAVPSKIVSINYQVVFSLTDPHGGIQSRDS
jgi:hypothetical protein